MLGRYSGRSWDRKVASWGPCRTFRHCSEIRRPPLASGMTSTAGFTAAPSPSRVLYAAVMPTTLIQSAGLPGNPGSSSMTAKR